MFLSVIRKFVENIPTRRENFETELGQLQAEAIEKGKKKDKHGEMVAQCQ